MFFHPVTGYLLRGGVAHLGGGGNLGRRRSTSSISFGMKSSIGKNAAIRVWASGNRRRKRLAN